MEPKIVIAVILIILIIAILGYLGKLALHLLEEISAGRKRKRGDWY